MSEQKVNYNHISPVGQLDDYSCWAASLKFWYKAAFTISKKQTGIIKKYNHLSDEDGSMGEAGLIEIISANKMYPMLAQPSHTFDAETVRKALSWGPVFVAYKSARWAFKHVVVIHGITDDAFNPHVNVMDPGSRFNTDTQKYEGRHLLKPLTEYGWAGEHVLYGVK